MEVFEKQPQAGGMLRYGIPDYRLSDEVIDSEIQDLLEVGFKLHTNAEANPRD